MHCISRLHPIKIIINLILMLAICPMIFPFKWLALHKIHYLKQQKFVFKSRGVVPFYKNWLRLRKGFPVQKDLSTKRCKHFTLLKKGVTESNKPNWYDVTLGKHLPWNTILIKA